MFTTPTPPKISTPAAGSQLSTFGGMMRRAGSRPNTRAYRMMPVAKITPAWKPPPGLYSPWNCTYRPNSRITGTMILATTFRTRCCSRSFEPGSKPSGRRRSPSMAMTPITAANTTTTSPSVS
jgi:hypothetical protein